MTATLRRPPLAPGYMSQLSHLVPTITPLPESRRKNSFPSSSWVAVKYDF